MDWKSMVDKELEFGVYWVYHKTDGIGVGIYYEGNFVYFSNYGKVHIDEGEPNFTNGKIIKAMKSRNIITGITHYSEKIPKPSPS